MVVKALSDPNHDREMEAKIDGSHFVTFSISRSIIGHNVSRVHILHALFEGSAVVGVSQLDSIVQLIEGDLVLGIVVVVF